MPELSPSQIEQYYAIRLDPYKLHHSKGSRWRAVCPIHGGSNWSQLSVNFAEGNFVCFSCGVKGGSAYTFEQQMLMRELNRSPMHDEVQASLENILQTPIAKRTYQQPLNEHQKGGWDRKQARVKYVYVDEEGAELFTVYRFVDRNGKKLTPADHPCSLCRQP